MRRNSLHPTPAIPLALVPAINPPSHPELQPAAPFLQPPLCWDLVVTPKFTQVEAWTNLQRHPMLPLHSFLLPSTFSFQSDASLLGTILTPVGSDVGVTSSPRHNQQPTPCVSNLADPMLPAKNPANRCQFPFPEFTRANNAHSLIRTVTVPIQINKKPSSLILNTKTTHSI